jgi:glc operon protein GlcG
MRTRRMAACVAILGLAVAVAVAPAIAQTSAAPPPVPYGPPINIETSKKVAAAAIAEARRQGFTMAIAIVDPAGDLVSFEKMDNTQAASVAIALDKARSSARFKRPTKAMQDILAAGGEGLRFLALEGAIPVEGGIPIMMDGKIVGAIGTSGGSAEQDGQIARAGTAAVK